MGSGWAPAEAGDPLRKRSSAVGGKSGMVLPLAAGQGPAPSLRAHDAAELIPSLEANYKKSNFLR